MAAILSQPQCVKYMIFDENRSCWIDDYDEEALSCLAWWLLLRAIQCQCRKGHINSLLIFMLLPLGAGSIIFSGFASILLSVHPRSFWALYWKTHRRNDVKWLDPFMTCWFSWFWHNFVSIFIFSAWHVMYCKWNGSNLVCHFQALWLIIWGPFY